MIKLAIQKPNISLVVAKCFVLFQLLLVAIKSTFSQYLEHFTRSFDVRINK